MASGTTTSSKEQALDWSEWGAMSIHLWLEWFKEVGLPPSLERARELSKTGPQEWRQSPEFQAWQKQNPDRHPGDLSRPDDLD